MKSIPITFITPNAINKHLSHALQMHIHTYTSSVYDLEPYSGIQGQRECLWTLVDPNMYMCHVDIFSHYSLCFFLSYFFPKRHYHPLHHCQSYDRVRYRSPMHLQQVHPALPFSTIPSVPKVRSYLCHISDTPPFVPVPLVSPFVPMFPVSLISSSMPL